MDATPITLTPPPSRPWPPLHKLPPRLSVVIPAYNERGRLPATLTEITRHLAAAEPSHEILVADDGSEDGTLAAAQEFAERDPRIRVLGLPHRGKGHAVRTGMLAARGQLVLFCDADLPMPVTDLTRLAGLLDPASSPVVIATREGDGAQRIGEPPHRRLMGRIFNGLVQALAVPGCEDTQCGLKCFTGESARAVFSRLTIDGFGFDVELLFLAHRLGYPVAEVPITWSHRPASRVDPLRDTVRMFRDVVRVRWNDLSGCYATVPVFPVGGIPVAAAHAAADLAVAPAPRRAA